MPRKDRAKPTAYSESLADHLLEISVEKWDAGAPITEIRMMRYQGQVPYDADGVSLFHDERWVTSDEALKELAREIRSWEKPDRESRGDGAVAFMREVTGFKLRPYQEEVVKRMYRNRRLCVRSPRGAGKSAIAANIIIHFLTVNNPCKIPTTAGSWAQLEEFLWPEIRLWVGRADWGLLGIKPKVNLLDMSFGDSDDDTVTSTQRAFAIRADEPEKMEGAHSENVLIVFDEAKAIEEPTFDAVEGTLSHEGAYALMISTPGNKIGRFADIQNKDGKYSDWDVMHITYQMQVDALEGAKREAKIAWAEARRRQWGEDSPMYRNHVLGEFADVDDSCIISPDHVALAVDRWKKWRDAGFPDTDEWVTNPNIRMAGADIAGQGKDRTALSHRIGYGIREIEYKHKASTMKTANTLMAESGQYPVIKIETDGIGAGVYDRCKEILETDHELPEADRVYPGVSVHPIVAGSKSTARDKSGELGFVNKRSELWWKVREMLEPDSGFHVMLPDDDDLIKELSTPKWELKDGAGEYKGRISVEKKDDIRKRLKGKSTDAADSVIIVLGDDGVEPLEVSVRVTVQVDQQTGTTFYDQAAPRQWPGFAPRWPSMYGGRW
jgi:hypothetical protein